MKNLSFLLFIAIIVSFTEAIAQNNITQKGKASYYADKFEGRLTASGEKYRHSKLTAAHKTLPFGTMVRVTNLSNSKTIDVKINDRGPFIEGRIIDLSKSAAESIDMINQGIADVEIKVINAGDGKNNNYETSKGVAITNEIQEREFYAFNVDRISPAKGFGVQIGTYEELANLVRLAQNLKASYKKKVTIQVSELNNRKVYRIIVGNEKSREKADALRKKLQKRYPDCFIYDFSFNK